MNRLSMLGKRAGLVTAMLAVLAGLGSSPAAASGAPASAHLFWANWDQGIGHANPDGSAAVRPFIDTAGRLLYVAANDQHVYWSNQYGSIGRAKLDGSDVQPSLIQIGSPGRPAAIALDETYVYWVEDSFFFQASIGRAKLDGTEVNHAFITGVGRNSGWTGLAVDGQHIYWASDDGIGRADINGLNAQNAYVPRPGGGSINSVAVDATHLYWTYDHRNATGADVFRTPLGTPSVHELLVFSPTDGPMQVAVDNQHVYFSRYGPDSIGRTDLDGANDILDFLSTGVINPVGIAVAPEHAPALSSNADLAGLSLAEGALAPAFSATTSGYGLQVEHATTDAHLTVTLDDPDATLTVNGNPATSGTAVSVALAVGENTLSVVVTAEDGTMKTYTVTITRAATLTVEVSPAKPGSTKPEFTTNPNVQLKTTAPAGATQVEISNDPGFGDARSFPVAADGSYAWTLSGDGEHTVYVRFLGAGSLPALSTTVKLDATAPRITKARFVKRRGGRVWLSVAAVDPVSGVARQQFAAKRNHPWAWRSFLGKHSDRTKQHFIWTRVADGAGNVSAWKKIVIPAKRNR